STPQSWIYRYIANGLKDTFKVAGKGGGMTYHSEFPTVRIDYILASHHWEIIAAYTSARSFSDHRPVITQLFLVDK
ncbi:MAG TPA: hypothetical protein VKP65_12515, partial [Rhodothermales bacterium]|nr:hypothetical protein [Rhodothermales bacterium]